MKRTKLVLAAGVVLVSGLALPGPANAAVHPSPTAVVKGIQPMLHPMGTACGEMMDDV
jgi:hypothetical protein